MADFWPTFGQLLADFWPTLGRLMADLGPALGRLWDDFGPIWGQLWADLGSTLGRLQANCGPTENVEKASVFAGFSIARHIPRSSITPPREAETTRTLRSRSWEKLIETSCMRDPEQPIFLIFARFWPRDQRPRNTSRMRLGQVSRTADHCGPILGHFGDFVPDPLSEDATM